MKLRRGAGSIFVELQSGKGLSGKTSLKSKAEVKETILQRAGGGDFQAEIMGSAMF